MMIIQTVMTTILGWAMTMMMTTLWLMWDLYSFLLLAWQWYLRTATTRRSTVLKEKLPGKSWQIEDSNNAKAIARGWPKRNETMPATRNLSPSSTFRPCCQINPTFLLLAWEVSPPNTMKSTRTTMRTRTLMPRRLPHQKDQRRSLYPDAYRVGEDRRQKMSVAFVLSPTMWEKRYVLQSPRNVTTCFMKAAYCSG